jgi:hypothetical protein
VRAKATPDPPDRPLAPRDRGARRRRPLLASATVLGLVLGLLGFAGVFTSGTDRALTGTNDLSTPPHPVQVDLQLASVTYDDNAWTATCADDWSDDLETGILTSDSTPLAGSLPYLGTSTSVCVRNVGEATARLSMTVPADSLVDTEVGCDPDEAAAEEGDCGTEGELSQDLYLGIPSYGLSGETRCAIGTGATSHRLSDLAGGAQPDLLDLEPGDEVALCVNAAWQGTQHRSYSDKVEWVFAFDGTAQ